jgi:hypothetical protein
MNGRDVNTNLCNGEATMTKDKFDETIAILTNFIEESKQGRMFSVDDAAKLLLAATRVMRLAIDPEFEPLTHVAELVLNHRYDEALRTINNVNKLYYAKNPSPT